MFDDIVLMKDLTEQERLMFQSDSPCRAIQSITFSSRTTGINSGM